MKDSIKINSSFDDFIKVFAEENSKHNLVSANDEKLLFEKHIYDSLSIKLFIDKYNIKNAKILDIGCGGGFPCIPISMEYPKFEITCVDSIRKKITSIETMKEKLALNNLNPVCGRIEALELGQFDIAVSRAVADLAKISEYALPKLKKGGYFIAYKSKKADEEIKNSKNVLKKYKSEIVDTIDYTLPLEDIYERKLICIKKED